MNSGRRFTASSYSVFAKRLKGPVFLVPMIALLAVNDDTVPLISRSNKLAYCTPSSGLTATTTTLLPAHKMMDAFKRDLLRVLRSDQMDESYDERALRGKSWNSYHKSSAFPDLIVYPESTQDVSSVLKLCHHYGVPVVAFGAGTSLEGQTLTPQKGISLDFSNMKKIVALHEKDMDVTVQAGIGYIELNELLRDKKIWFPLDPGPGASVGGMCACRCSGSTAVRYGSMRENVLALTAVLPDGTVIHTGSRARKSSAGYDLTRLLIGSEGTLAIITEATLKVYGIPAHSYAVRIAFPNGVRDAANLAQATLNCGVTVGRCELLDSTMISIVNKNSPKDGSWEENATLLYEITGVSPRAVQEQVDIVVNLAKQYGASSIATATTEEDTRELWRMRKECLWTAMGNYPGKDVMITDVCVPLSALPDLIDQTSKEIATMPHLHCPIVAHAGDGNFHVLIFFDSSSEKESKDAKLLANSMAMRAISMGGTCTGEHGVGMGKMNLLEVEAGAGAMNLMKHIKRSIDPRNILNPGKVININSATTDSDTPHSPPITITITQPSSSNEHEQRQPPPPMQDRRDRTD